MPTRSLCSEPCARGAELCGFEVFDWECSQPLGGEHEREVIPLPVADYGHPFDAGVMRGRLSEKRSGLRSPDAPHPQQIRGPRPGLIQLRVPLER